MQIIGTVAGEVAMLDAEENEQYTELLARVRARFALIAPSAPLFTTDAENLFEAFLDALPPGRRQHYTCHSCQSFVNTYGGLVTLREDGQAESALWIPGNAPEFFRPSIDAMRKLIARAKVTGVFLSSESVWGRPSTPGKENRTWFHLAVVPPAARVFKKRVLTAGQVSAEKREEHHMVARALGEYTRPMVDEALRVLRSDALYRAEKVIGPATWLAKLHADRDAAKHARAKDNVLWRAVALAPAGFCHPKSSMIGTLLDDIAAGLSFESVSARFKEKMHPLAYQRPQAAPTAGAILAAEKIFAELGLAPALERRFARLEEIETIWRPLADAAGKPVDAASKPAVFGHLKPKGKGPLAPTLNIPAQNITWEKFARTVLPVAEGIEYYTQARTTDSYAAFATAVHAGAPPILQWDREERRNPVSWYLYNGGSSPAQWALPSNMFVKVTGISLMPSSWGGAPQQFHHGDGVMFVLEGAKDTRSRELALFPEILKSELHGVRAVIEAHSKSGSLQGQEEASACGILIAKGPNGRQTGSYRFRVTASGATQEYIIDRWD